MTLPKLEVNFYQKAANAIKRSEKGIVAFVCVDDGVQALTKRKYIPALNITGLNAANKKLVEQCWLGQPNKVIVIALPTGGTFTDASDTLNNTAFSWLVCNIAADQADVVAYAKEKGCKTVVYNKAADDMHIVNFKTSSVKVIDADESAGYYSQNGIDYIVRIAGLLAGLPFTRSCTSYVLTDLLECTTLESPADGEFYLYNDSGKVRIAYGINSLTTLTTNITADMQKITIVEGMDIIREDIETGFKDYYQGKYKNKLDNQKLWLSAVNGYFRVLEKQDILNNEYDNRAEVDIEEQRAAHIANGTAEAVDWTDIEVQKNTYKNYVYTKCNVHILDAIEALEFNVYMF